MLLRRGRETRRKRIQQLQESTWASTKVVIFVCSSSFDAKKPAAKSAEQRTHLDLLQITSGVWLKYRGVPRK
jgi:hypothetical protein